MFSAWFAMALVRFGFWRHWVRNLENRVALSTLLWKSPQQLCSPGRRIGALRDNARSLWQPVTLTPWPFSVGRILEKKQEEEDSAPYLVLFPNPGLDISAVIVGLPLSSEEVKCGDSSISSIRSCLSWSLILDGSQDGGQTCPSLPSQMQLTCKKRQWTKQPSPDWELWSPGQLKLWHLFATRRVGTGPHVSCDWEPPNEEIESKTRQVLHVCDRMEDILPSQNKLKLPSVSALTLNNLKWFINTNRSQPLTGR